MKSENQHVDKRGRRWKEERITFWGGGVPGTINE